MAVNISIPLEFELINRTWHVKELTERHERKLLAEYPHGEEPKGIWGLCDPEHAVIYIRKSSSKDHMMHTFLHELGHALFYALGWDVENEEEKVDALGAALHQWLKSKRGSFTVA